MAVYTLFCLISGQLAAVLGLDMSNVGLVMYSGPSI